MITKLPGDKQGDRDSYDNQTADEKQDVPMQRHSNPEAPVPQHCQTASHLLRQAPQTVVWRASITVLSNKLLPPQRSVVIHKADCTVLEDLK